MRAVLLSLTQALGLLMAGLGLYLLAGLAWTLVVAGLGIVAVATVAELAGRRAGSGGGRF